MIVGLALLREIEGNTSVPSHLAGFDNATGKRQGAEDHLLINEVVLNETEPVVESFHGHPALSDDHVDVIPPVWKNANRKPLLP